MYLIWRLCLPTSASPTTTTFIFCLVILPANVKSQIYRKMSLDTAVSFYICIKLCNILDCSPYLEKYVCLCIMNRLNNLEENRNR